MKRTIYLCCAVVICLLMMTGFSLAQTPAAGGAPVAAGKSEYQAEKERIAQFKTDYAKANDKLGFLLANVDSPHDEILLEVARRLVEFDDPRSIAALKKLQKHEPRKELGESVSTTARYGLEWFAAAPDLKKLKPGMSPAKLEALVKKYAWGYDVAHGAIYTFMKGEYEKDPKTYVPLIVEFYADSPLARELAKKYPDLEDKGLETCLQSTEVKVIGNHWSYSRAKKS